MDRVQILTNHLVAGAGSAGSLFAAVPQAPLDPILGTAQMFARDPSALKVNLGIGAYRDDSGAPVVLQCVREAERRLLADPRRNLEYLPQHGDVRFCKAARELLFGAESPVLPSIATVQALSGTGALRVCSGFIAKFMRGRLVLYSNPTWGNHVTILQHAGVPAKPYRYYKPGGLDIDGLLEDLTAAPEGSIVLLHACAHNPTGVDPTHEQWVQIANLMRRRSLVPWFDSAYQGFASGSLDRDAWAIRYFAAAGFEMMCCQSFAKNCGMYGQRVGALHIRCADAALVPKVVSQLDLVIRGMYSSPPRHGAEVVGLILRSPELYAQWVSELKGMADRINTMRGLLRQHLERLGTPGNWEHITSQIGMFSYTGLTKAQCQALISQHHIYLLLSGRISMAGVNTHNVEYIAKCINAVVCASA